MATGYVELFGSAYFFLTLVWNSVLENTSYVNKKFM
jgi:hypothetical protein